MSWTADDDRRRVRALSMFSGMEAASVAARGLGWEFQAFAEVDPAACAVLAHRYPGVPNLGDVTAADWTAFRGRVDVVVGGPPCQAFSMAGLRQSLADRRGNLSLHYMRALHAIRPAWCLTENVPGWLSTRDNAFGCFLGGLVGADAPLDPPNGKRWGSAGVVDGPDYRAAWRVLDAQGYLPQRRRRVLVVAARSDTGGDPLRVLFETEAEVERRLGGRPRAAGLFAPRPGGGFDPAALGQEGEGPAAAGPRGAGADGLGGDDVPCFHADALFRSGDALTPSADAEGRVRLRPPGKGFLTDGTCYALTTGQAHAVVAESPDPDGAPRPVLRRLTWRESLRLQGFPDDYLDGVTLNGKPLPAAARRKLCGNSWAVPVVSWVFRRIDAALRGADPAGA